MSKIINDSLTLSGTGCFIAVHIWQQWASKVKNICISPSTTYSLPKLSDTTLHLNGIEQRYF